MRKKYLFNACFIALIALLSCNLISCSSSKKIKYFQDIPDSGQLKAITKSEYVEPVIRVDDILTILIQTIDPQATSMINIANAPLSGGASPIGASAALSTPPVSGYLVNKEGIVQLPVLGDIKVIGYTTSQLADTIRTLARKYFKDPNVIVRYANFKISVTGEVLKPGQYIVANEKVSILDAIAMAGDLTIFGKRENVLLIRENPDGTKTPYRFNLKKSDVMSSPYYYLRQNDIVYVEPRKAKSDATDASQNRYISLAGALLSIILVLAYRVK
ncbi:polysaccharide biosynthesis/export family protein [Mucilaginibacter aquaedulcis]|uniref:polysaccharide biosynthesis/export family protein n=1 Tax=Mucilaginibacter aquaedulcis TaxID=1187081 RepID=UPI0025B32394|nr:polysaccharide biosynthesis/export family protein [Mucilaginibacter aquaedulcis]MDN3549761.1 polysaccharide biosynthesis/export family protein [Mucilaginibacter aquaedulcis]